MVSNRTFKVVMTTALVLTIAGALAGPRAVAVYDVVTAAYALFAMRRWRLNGERVAMIGVELAIAASPLLGWGAYVGFGVNAAAVAFVTWFAWCFRMTRLF